MTEAPRAKAVETRLATADDLPALEANETAKTKGLSASYLALQAEGDFYVVVGVIDGEIGGRVILDTRQGGDDASRGDFADAVVITIGDV